MRIYERLSQIYDVDWGKFSKQYVSLIVQLFKERGIAKAKVLDLACGTGTLAIELAGRGHSVHGIDISTHMIAMAKLKSTGLSGLSFEVQEMTEFHVEDKYDLVTCTFDSINYLLDIDAVKAMLSRVVGALYGSGLFVFDSNTERLYTNRHMGTHFRELGGEVFVQKCEYDSEKKEATTVFEFSDDAAEIHKQRPYDLTELEPLLMKSGLHVVNTFSHFDRRPFNSESERLICIAEKEAMEDL